MRFAPMLPWWAIAVVFTVLLAGAVLGMLRGTAVSSGDRARRGARRVVMVLILAAIAVRPAFGHAHQQAQLSNLDVFFVVDRTPSVNAEDYHGHQPRLVGVRSDIKAIVASLAGARFAMITFANTSDVRVPPTINAAAIDTAADLLSPLNSSLSKGSGIDEPVATVTKLLAEAKAEQPKRTRVVIYLGDGEQTAHRPVGSFAPWAPYVSGGAVLGYGSTSGGKMLSNPYTGPPTYITDANSQAAVSKYDPATLRTAAAQIGVPFTHRTGPGRVRASLHVPPTRSAGPGGEGAQRPGEAYWLLAVVLGLLAVMELANVARRAGPVWRTG